MNTEKTQTRFEMVKEFYDLINNSYELDIYDETCTHEVYNSIFHEKRRHYSDMDGHSFEIFVELSDGYRYIAPHNQIKGIYKERDFNCKSDECPLFDFINIYANELGDDVGYAIESIKFKTSICGREEERILMYSSTRDGGQIYETLLTYLKNIESRILADSRNYNPDYF